MLAASGITPEHAALRGYMTCGPAQSSFLARTKVVKAGQRIPGLLVPMLRSDGSTWGYQYRPDEPRLRDGKPVKYETPWQQRNGIDVPPGVGPMLADPSIPLWVTEGVKKADCGAVNGLCIVGLVGVWNWLGANTSGGKMALPEWRDIALNGRRVIIAFDGDVARKESVQKAVRSLAAYLATKGARIEYLWLPDTDDKTGLDDYLTGGHTVDDLWRLVKPTAPPPATPEPDQASQPAPQPEIPVTQTMSLDDVRDVFRRWLGDALDIDALNAVMACAAAERLDGDPLWLMLVSGSGNAKTELVQSLGAIGALVVSTITSEAALLSGTPAKDRAKDATGGLLREIGDTGILVVKDVTSILSMHRDQRAQVLAALREIYDGYWVRRLGTDGGRKIPWTGRVATIGAVTTAWDAHHAVIAAMGDRFVLCRTSSRDHRLAAGRQAITNTGGETVMRHELRQAVAGLLDHLTYDGAIQPDSHEAEMILRAADLVTLARTAVEYSYNGDVIDAHAPEMPTRFAKQLAQLFRGAMTVGLDRGAALRLAIRCARDSMPPLRLAIIDHLADHPYDTTNAIRQALGKPYNTVRRQLDALHMLGIADCDEIPGATAAGKTVWHYTLANDIDPTAIQPPTFPKKSCHPPVPCVEEGPEAKETHTNVSPRAPSDFFGNGITPTNGHTAVVAPSSPAQNANYRAGLCMDCQSSKPSAGRPRCEQCHRTHITVMRGYDR
ncbi:hypothetical protein MHAE_04400 [Mycobacterium haemophilum DSM 44634]|uniref:DUF3854 domain-containing protein n=1 Tax=Mycobacterium haemophilum TaxID=29311 RepID=UPI0006D5C307|nr:DUF3854 domain-containing protein [Mycobacterium haemophilum]